VAQALYRKYRSKSLDDVVGQRHVTDILGRAIKAGRVSHAYLLTGPRGVGKTSVARILAHEINGLPYSDESSHLDIIEIDAASNNGVEDVRDLREKVQIAPVSAEKKVYIIDEVHMLSKAAFNALLKTLEEPPQHVVFILATTDVDKLPATIISRTQRYGFRAIAENDAVEHLRHIADEEKIVINDDALKLIAQRGDGSFRDSISLLDQLSSLTDDKTGITAELIEATLGLAPNDTVDAILAAVEAHDVSKLAALLEQAEGNGISPVTLTDQLTHALRNHIIKKPQLLPLLDGLLDVAKSSQPGLKLLSVLGTAALEHKPAKTAALAAPVLEVSASVAELKELADQATKPVPSMPPAPQSVVPTPVKEPVKTTATPAAAPISSATNAAEPEHHPVLKQSDARSGEVLGTEESGGAAAATATVPPQAFNWTALVEHARKNYIALFSVLSKCHHELEGDDLTLYTLSAFYKKKMDDPKYSGQLYDCLRAIGCASIAITTVPTGAPLKDSQAAAVAAIMGGGEEVAL